MLAAIGLIPLLAPAIDLKAHSAVIMDAKTGKVLWGKAPTKKMFPASTTKIMTSLLLIESAHPHDLITAPKDVEKVGESSMHLKPGERVTAKDMLYAMMLRSANDGCYAVAVHVAGSVPAFAKMMNDRAREIGCTDTNFTNPNGLHHPNHVSTAKDLAMMAREAFKYEIFNEIVRTRKARIERSKNQEDRWMVSRNRWLAKDATADGVKTGYTRPAGSTYVGSATRNGWRVITALMKSETWQEDHKAMLDYAFKNFEHVVAVRKGEVIGEATVESGVQSDVPLVINEDVIDVVRKGEKSGLVASLELNPTIQAPVQAFDRLGTVRFTDGTGYVVSLPVFAAETVERQAILGRVASGGNSGFLIVASSLCLGVYWMRTKARRLRLYGKTPARKGNFSIFS